MAMTKRSRAETRAMGARGAKAVKKAERWLRLAPARGEI
ncbi:Hypothetical protein A7982_09866 [Minicystis rosea]|nr:Hypothetical protein A7982_09866 [Minicystis rosea]